MELRKSSSVLSVRFRVLFGLCVGFAKSRLRPQQAARSQVIASRILYKYPPEWRFVLTFFVYSYTAQDPFGRVESSYTVTGKCDATQDIFVLQVILTEC